MVGMKVTRFSKSFLNRVVGCRYVGETFWLDVASPSGKVYPVSIKIGDNCGWTGVQGIPNGILCSHMITALRYLASRAVVEGAFNDRPIKGA
jgi:hypothetical protein